MLRVGTGSIRWPRPLSFSPGFKCNRYYIEMSSRYTKGCIRVYKTRDMLGETPSHPPIALLTIHSRIPGAERSLQRDPSYPRASSSASGAPTVHRKAPKPGSEIIETRLRCFDHYADHHTAHHGRVNLTPLTIRFGVEAEKPARKRALESDPTGIRTRVFAVRGRCPWPLDDGAVLRSRQSLSEEWGYVKAVRPAGD